MKTYDFRSFLRTDFTDMTSYSEERLVTSCSRPALSRVDIPLTLSSAKSSLSWESAAALHSGSGHLSYWSKLGYLADPKTWKRNPVLRPGNPHFRPFA